MTRYVCEKAAQNVAQSFFCQNKYITCTLGKSSPKICASSVIFESKVPPKEPPIRRKFAQSGHPGANSAGRHRAQNREMAPTHVL
jgi:hypothetical protein